MEWNDWDCVLSAEVQASRGGEEIYKHVARNVYGEVKLELVSAFCRKQKLIN